MEVNLKTAEVWLFVIIVLDGLFKLKYPISYPKVLVLAGFLSKKSAPKAVILLLKKLSVALLVVDKSINVFATFLIWNLSPIKSLSPSNAPNKILVFTLPTGGVWKPEIEML